MSEITEGEKGLKRVLGTPGLLLMGIGAIIGAGIFILTGVVSALYAGPGIIYHLLYPEWRVYLPLFVMQNSHP